MFHGLESKNEMHANSWGIIKTGGLLSILCDTVSIDINIHVFVFK